MPGNAPPTFVPLLLPDLIETAPSREGWLHEIKHDGFRTEVAIGGGRARAFTRRGHDWSERYARIVEAAAALPCRSALIDGEVIVQEPDGRIEPGDATGDTRKRAQLERRGQHLGQGTGRDGQAAGLMRTSRHGPACRAPFASLVGR
jgi:ATP-dependent DNA ligase